MKLVTGEKQWYAIYTRARAEKKVHTSLLKEGFEAYLPLIKRLRQWSDRKKLVEEPLFRSYIFVRVDEKNLYNALNVFGALKYIKFENKAVPIPDKQIEAIRIYLEDPEPDEDSDEALSAGQLVRVKSGPMEGLIGKLVSYKNKFRLIIMIDAIGQVIRLNIPRSRVELVKESEQK